MSQSLTDQQYWEKDFAARPKPSFDDSPYAPYLKKFLVPDPARTCLEIGAYPGGNLGYLAKHFGFQPTALDFLDGIDWIRQVMEENGIHNCRLIKADFLAWAPDQPYDVVCSHGFIEHFHDFEAVLAKHVDALKPGGTLVLTLPHLRAYQLWLRKLLYTPEYLNTILTSHNLRAMDLPALTSLLRAKSMTILFARHIRGMAIWFPPTPEIVRRNRLPFYYLAKILGRITDRLGLSSPLWSPEILIVARKK